MDNGYPFYHRQLDIQTNVKTKTGSDRKWKKKIVQCIKNSHCRCCCYKNENVENCRYSTTSTTTDSIPSVPTQSTGATINTKPNFRSDLLRCEIIKCKKLGLPLNPHTWSWVDVLTWLRDLSKTHHLTFDYSKFVMNGKGLCFMSLAGFKSRCPRAGKLLHSDLQRKMIAHIYLLVLRNHKKKKQPTSAATGKSCTRESVSH